MTHKEIALDIASLLDRKQADYGRDNISRFGTKGILVRVNDKVERLINLTWDIDKEPNFESVKDSWMDIAGYAILALKELKDEEPIEYEVVEVVEERDWNLYWSGGEVI